MIIDYFILVEGWVDFIDIDYGCFCFFGDIDFFFCWCSSGSGYYKGNDVDCEKVFYFRICFNIGLKDKFYGIGCDIMII